MRTGILFVLSGASGVGKGTIRSRLREQVPDIYHSVSVTSRAPRPGEREGMDYFFRTREQVEAMARAGELIEWVEYVGNYYGIPKRPVDEHLAQGVDVILEPETRGAKAVARLYPQAVLIFLVPPSLEALEQRLRTRRTETEETIRARLARAREEMQELHLYHYCILNDDALRAAQDLVAIVRAERCKAERVAPEMKRRILGE